VVPTLKSHGMSILRPSLDNKASSSAADSVTAEAVIRSGQLVGLTAIASIEIRASGIGRATLGDDRAGFGSAENARV
jgi:hypothetical protein